MACHEKTVAVAPSDANAWYNFGLTLSLMGRPLEALGHHDRALPADSKYALARFGRAQALQQTGQIAAAVEDYGKFIAAEPRHHEARSYRLFALHYLPDVSRETLFAEHVAFGRSLPPAPKVAFANPPDPARRLRIAILSPDLREHAGAYFIEPVLRHLDSAQFELYLYHDHFREDAVSARFKGLAAVWRNFVGQPVPMVEKNNPRRCARDSDRPRGPHGTEPAAALCPATGTGAGKLSRLSGHDGCARHGLSLD